MATETGQGVLVPQLTRDHPLRIVLPATPLSVRRALGLLEGRIGADVATGDQLSSMQIVVAEALNNIIEHAYQGDPGTVQLTVEQAEDGLDIVVIDGGAPMPDGVVPLGTIKDYPSDPMQMPEGGFGWFLIHDLTKNLSYQRAEGRNILKFTIPPT